MTLRQLQHMADGHQKTAWNHTLAIGLMFAKAMGAKGLPSIAEIIPERYREAPQSISLADEEAAADAAFASLEIGLRSWSKQQDWSEPCR